MNVFYSRLELNEGMLILATTEKGLCWVSGWNEDEADMKRWLLKKNPASKIIKADEPLAAYKEEFQAYFSGELQTFSVPLDLHGTSFQKKVWKELQLIPFGETSSYSDIAEKIGNPKSVRAVGTAIGRNPVLIAVPCHRVVQKNGALGGFRAGLSLKKTLLQHEQSF